ncbi:hypothetical protein B0A48_12235 [Cryoendolithus antarcticus]|uniref:Uncharacterized protein n=1 Tax=Cryoendolithus antarcticus TaxID=1507870 RepID=A0A1V8SU71_9PEZI|nr:hypothetical protein B0A48_12235 [Cryoendolithus antarcticus]
MPEVFPSILWCGKLGATGDAEANQEIFDVRFWPHESPDGDSVFALVGGRNVFVCRTKLNADPPFEIIRWWRDADPARSLNSICWTENHHGRPLLCAAGLMPKSVLVYDVEHDEVARTISGHGKAINDLQTCPTRPSIIASASEDYTVRLWNLNAKYEKQPCIAILAGQGHKQPLLALAFHPNGRWLLSSAMDTAIALWAIPTEVEVDEAYARDQEPLLITYPAFITEEVHFNFVDSLDWYGDLILSRAARGSNDKSVKNEILLWQIDGFDSDGPVPEKPAVPYPGLYTRSAFHHAPESRGIYRLLTFKTDHTSRFYHRFGFLHRLETDTRPILVMGTEESKYLFWDLQRCEEGEEPGEYPNPTRGTKSVRGRPKKSRGRASGLDRLGGLRRESSVASSEGTGPPNTSSPSLNTTPAAPTSTSVSNAAVNPGGRRFMLDDPFTPLKPHLEVLADTTLSSKEHFATNQLSWSADGKWLVGTGDRGMITVFYRERVA